MNVIFFGSTTDSVLVLEKLSSQHIVAVVTQPARPAGRKQILTPTPVELWAKNHNIAVLTFPTNKQKPWEYENEEVVVDTLQPFKADLLVSASYGEKIPTATIADAKFGGINVHPSLLPRFRGTDPVPWTLLSGDHQTGVSIVTLSQSFDEGKIIAQKKIPVDPSDETEPLRAKLFAIGADLLAETLPEYISGHLRGNSQDNAKAVYARRLTRDDGYVTWDILEKAMSGEDVDLSDRPEVLALDRSHISIVISKALRALLLTSARRRPRARADRARPAG